MKKTFKHNGKEVTVEILEKAKVDIHVGWKPNPAYDETKPEKERADKYLPVFEIQPRNVIIGYVGGKEKSRKIIPVEDQDLVQHADAMENELIQMTGGAKSHKVKLSSKGYK